MKIMACFQDGSDMRDAVWGLRFSEIKELLRSLYRVLLG